MTEKKYKSDVDAINNAVRIASNGRFSSLQNLVASFENDVSLYAYGHSKDQQKQWLAKYCGIIMDNDDTGAISGKDAGGSVVKTTHSVVDEGGKTEVPGYTYDISQIGNIHFRWYTSVNKNEGAKVDGQNITSNEQHIVNHLQNHWMPAAVDLVTKTYSSVNFIESVNNKPYYVNVYFVDEEDSNRLASANNNRININLKYFKTGFTDLSSEDGVSNYSYEDSSGKKWYGHATLDRVLAHELTHMLMFQNIANYCNNIPTFVLEGMAEVTHGIDDERYDNIYNVLNKSLSELQNDVMNLNQTKRHISNDGYAAGYMLMRYLARQSATSGVPNYLNDSTYMPYYGQSYRNNRSEVVITNTSEKIDTVNLNNYAETATKLDASNYSYEGMNIIGSNRSETFILSNCASHITPGGGNDVIYDYNYDKHSGKRYYFGNNDGTNIINGFNGGNKINQDYESRIYLTKGIVDGISYSNGILKIWSDGTDIDVQNITKRYSGSDLLGLKIIDSLEKANVYCFYENGNTVWYCDEKTGNKNAIGQMNTSNQYFYSFDKKKVRLTNKFSGNVDITKFDNTVSIINASDVTSNLTFLANSRVATTYLGKGNDTIIFGVGSSRDVVYGFDTSKDQIKLKTGSTIVDTYARGNGDVLLRTSWKDDSVLELAGVGSKYFKVNGLNSQVMNAAKSETIEFGTGSVRTHLYGFDTSKDQIKLKTGSTIVDTYARGNGDVLLRTSWKDDSVLELAGVGSKYFKVNGINNRVMNAAKSETIEFGKGSTRTHLYGFNTSKDQIKLKSGNTIVDTFARGNGDVLLRTSWQDDSVLELAGVGSKYFKVNGINSRVMNAAKSETIEFGKGTGRIDAYNFNAERDQIKLGGNSSLSSIVDDGKDTYLRYDNQNDVLKLVGITGKNILLNGRRIATKTSALYSMTSDSISSTKNNLNYVSNIQYPSQSTSNISLTDNMVNKQNKINVAYGH